MICTEVRSDFAAEPDYGYGDDTPFTDYGYGGGAPDLKVFSSGLNTLNEQFHDCVLHEIETPPESTTRSRPRRTRRASIDIVSVDKVPILAGVATPRKKNTSMRRASISVTAPSQSSGRVLRKSGLCYSPARRWLDEPLPHVDNTIVHAKMQAERISRRTSLGQAMTSSLLGEEMDTADESETEAYQPVRHTIRPQPVHARGRATRRLSMESNFCCASTTQDKQPRMPRRGSPSPESGR